MSKAAKGNIIHTIPTEAAMTAVKGWCDATDAEILATSPDNFQTKNKKKGIIHVKIRGRKERYMSTLRTNTDMTK